MIVGLTLALIAMTSIAACLLFGIVNLNRKLDMADRMAQAMRDERRADTEYLNRIVRERNAYKAGLLAVEKLGTKNMAAVGRRMVKAAGMAINDGIGA